MKIAGSDTELPESCECGTDFTPFDILEAWVDTQSPITEIDEHGQPSGYQASGFTDVIWDTQVSVGYGCRTCGDVVVTAKSINIGGVEFIPHKTGTDRFGR